MQSIADLYRRIFTGGTRWKKELKEMKGKSRGKRKLERREGERGEGGEEVGSHGIINGNWS